MSQTATIIIAIIAGIAFFYPLISSLFQSVPDDFSDRIIPTGHRMYATRNKKGELVEVDLNKADVEQFSRFVSAYVGEE